MFFKIGLAVLFVITGIYLLIDYFIVKKRGIILDAVISGYATEADNVHIVPIVDFTYKGESYSMSTNVPFKKEKYPVGSAVQIYYEEKNIEYVSIKGESGQLKQGVFFFVLGAVLLVLNILRYF